MLSLIVFAFGCSKDDPAPVDVRDAAVGTFTGTAKVYVKNGNDIVDAGLSPESMAAKVTKGSNAETILIDLDGDVLTGTKVKAADNGFTFDLNSVTFDGTTFSGYAGYELGGSQYDGAFTSSNKKLNFFIQGTEAGITIIVEFSGTKQ